MSFNHYISTRFNVPTKIWGKTRDGHQPLTEKWLSDRFEIFINYCLPSFKNQTNQNFQWFVFFDTNTPEKYIEIIEEIKSSYINFKPVFVNDFEEMFEKFKLISSSHDRDFVITTDIDNDDMIQKDFIKNIQELYQPLHNLAIDLKLGLQLTKTSADTAFAQILYYTGSPFVSLVEERNNVKTVMHQSHTLYRNSEHFVYYDEEPRYIQFIHEFNLVNSTLPNMKRLYSIDYNQYGVMKKNQLKISKSEAIIFNIKRSLSIVLKLLKK